MAIEELGVNAALYETAVFSSKHLIAAYGAGYLLGTGLAWGIQFFAPTLWDSIGQGIYKVVNWIISATTNDALGYAMEQSASLFDLDTASYDALSLTGGDYGVTYEWASMNGGGDCSRHYWAICDNW